MKPVLSILALVMVPAVVAARAQAPTPGWQLSGQVNQGYSSNVRGALSHPAADATTDLTLQLGRSWVTPHASFSLSYVPEGMHYARYQGLDYIAQSLQQTWQYAAGSHTTLAWTSSFQRFPERGGQAQMGAASLASLQSASQAQQADTFLTSGTTSFSVQRQTSLRANWSAQLTGSWLGFQQDAAVATTPGFSLQSSQTKSLSSQLGWNYRLTADRSVGVSANEGEMWFTLPVQHTRYANLEATLSQAWGATSLQLGAGPGFNWVVSSAGPAAGQPPRSWAADASLRQQIARTQLGLSWNHRVQAGLTPGSISTDQLALQWQQQWGKWQGGASLGNSRMAAIGGSQAARNGLFAAAQLAYALTHWSLEASGNYYSQEVATLPGRVGALSRLQASVGVRYIWQGAHE
ncbi:MAG: hypothetical protein ACTHJX_00890 [Terriglobales bacterium]